MEKAASSSMKILMFPWLAHGHIFAFLELAKRILNRKTRSFHIYCCTTPINFPSINNFIRKNKLDEHIELVKLNLRSDELPPHYHTTKNLPSHLNFTLLKTLQTAYPAFSDIVTALKPDLIIYDRFQPWAAKVADHKIPAVHFSSTGSCILSSYHHQYTHGNAIEFPFPAIKFDDPSELKTLYTVLDFLKANVFDVDQDAFYIGNFKQSCELVLVKTSHSFEGKYIDYLSTLSKKKIIPVGPLVRVDDHDHGDDEMIIQWLDKKKPNSTVFISFGSEYFLSKENIEQIANALDELSSDEVNFIWIIRFPVGLEVSLESVLPEGFLQRVEKKGVVLTGWAPQIKILSHPNTGGFVSHCGWSSVMESVYLGVPVIAMPMKLDQPYGARVLSEAGCAVEVPRGYRGGDIAQAIRKVVVERSGEGMRQRARELSNKLKMEEESEMDLVAEELWQLCSKHKN